MALLVVRLTGLIVRTGDRLKGQGPLRPLNLENPDEKPLIPLIDANRETQKELNLSMVHQIDEREIKKRKPTIDWISAE